MRRTIATAGAVTLLAGLFVAPASAEAEGQRPGQPRPLAESAEGKPSESTPPAMRTASEGAPTVTADDIEFAADRTLEYGSAADAGLLPRFVDRIGPDVAGFLEPSPERPLYAGAVALAGSDGVIAAHEAVGHAVRYSAYEDGEAVELPPDQRVPMRRDTIVDLASLTKVFTATAVMQQVEAGRVDLDAPVARYIPEFAQHGKGDIVVRQLLTHTSGLPAWLALYQNWDTPEERTEAVYAAEPEAPPGSEYIYSDLGYITLGKLVEEVTGKRLDEVVEGAIAAPLGMDDTMFTPPESLRPRVAATEYQPWTGRGMVRGSVHDENAWSLGGVAGHAGLFSTARDLAVFAQTLLNGGVYDGVRILEQDTVRAMLRDWNAELPGRAHGLGFDLGQRWFMDALTSPVTFGHTGFTGTSLVVDPLSGSFAVLLSNRVHPTRDWGSNNPARRAVARNLGRAVPVSPAEGRQAWFSGVGDDRSAVLSLPLPVPDAGARLEFDLWYDTEVGYDLGVLEASRDGGETWQAVPLDLRTGRHSWSVDGPFSGFGGRQWLTAQAELAGDVTDVRWRYTSDALYQGRGVYVDGVRAWAAGGGLIFNGHRPSDAERFVADGWHRSPG